MTRRRAVYAALALVCALPRLVVVFHERAAILSAYTEKSDLFAQVFVQTGTFGMLPGQPSASTQPLYGWFLIPVYWLFGRSWLSVGLSQTALAIVTTWLVYEIGRRLVRPRFAIAAAAIATLDPYLVWHDVHVNREICDQTCAAGLVLLTLLVAERPTKTRAALLGLVLGLAMLGNTRLVFLPVVIAAYLVWRLPRARATATVAALVLAGAGVAVTPWLVRNKLDVGCWAMTTDGRAMWKANNVHTYSLLESGQWIDNVTLRETPRPHGHNLNPLGSDFSPEEARGRYDMTDHRVLLHPDECLQMTFYENRTFAYWEAHPAGKLKLAALSAKLLWQPNVLETSGRSGKGTELDVARGVIEPAWMIVLYALAFAGLFVVPRAFAALVLLLFAYDTACALVFVGATRYRIAFDFLLALLAAAALQRAETAWRDRRP